MTEQNIRYSTSHLHELVAEIERRIFDGSRVDHRSAFAARRQGSAYVVWFVPTRESLDFPEMTKEKSKSISDKTVDAYIKAYGEKNEELTVHQKWKLSDETEAEFDKLMEQSQPLPKELLDRMQELRDKAEDNREREQALNELAQQSQELGMYEVDKEQVKVYSKEELDDLYWTDLQEVGYKYGVKGRNRNKLTNAILQAQEKAQ